MKAIERSKRRWRRRDEEARNATVDIQLEHMGAAAGDEGVVQPRTGDTGEAGIRQSVQREGR